METHLGDAFARTADGREAEAILRRCVHCGFCTATCPTYQLLGEENDGPRGRIYLMKAVLEGEPPTREVQVHLDRCLTCRSCESTCPSGVQYGRLLDIGRARVEQHVTRPAGERIARMLLREVLPNRALFEPAVRAGRAVRGVLPRALRQKLEPGRDPGQWPAGRHTARVVLLEGCVQPSMMPNIDSSTARVLDRLGVGTVVSARAGCCGAIRHHLADPAGALDDVRRNVDAWCTELDAGAQAILINASGCTAMVKEYGHLLRDDPVWAERAARVSAATKDLSEWVPARVAELGLPADLARGQRVAFHSPCTLQHGQQVRGAVEALLQAVGAQLCPVADAHLCCGSAGTYSLLQPELSQQLRERKLVELQRHRPEVILSANVGCLSQLDAGAAVPVMHWVEWLDALVARHAAGQQTAPAQVTPAQTAP